MTVRHCAKAPTLQPWCYHTLQICNLNSYLATPVSAGPIKSSKEPVDAFSLFRISSLGLSGSWALYCLTLNALSVYCLVLLQLNPAVDLKSHLKKGILNSIHLTFWFRLLPLCGDLTGIPGFSAPQTCQWENCDYRFPQYPEGNNQDST